MKADISNAMLRRLSKMKKIGPDYLAHIADFHGKNVLGLQSSGGHVLVWDPTRAFKIDLRFTEPAGAAGQYSVDVIRRRSLRGLCWLPHDLDQLGLCPQALSEEKTNCVVRQPSLIPI